MPGSRLDAMFIEVSGAPCAADAQAVATALTATPPAATEAALPPRVDAPARGDKHQALDFARMMARPLALRRRSGWPRTPVRAQRRKIAEMRVGASGVSPSSSSLRRPTGRGSAPSPSRAAEHQERCRAPRVGRCAAQPRCTDASSHRLCRTCTETLRSYCQMLWMRWRENAQTATFSSMLLLSLSSSMTRSPSLNLTPARTSAISSWPLNLRQRAWAASSSL